MKNESNQPNIIIKGILLLQSQFTRVNEFMHPLQATCHFHYEKHLTASKVEGQGVLTADIKFIDGKGEEAATINCSFLGMFAVEGDVNMEMDEFMDNNAPAHILPFIREHVANLTIKASIPPLYLPPYNIKALIEDSKQVPPSPNS